MARQIDDRSVMLRCRQCGYLHSWFKGWAFTGHICSGSTEKHLAMLHDWEVVPVEEEPARQITTTGS